MTDSDCTKWVLPAISLGYAVVNDPAGKLRFWNDKADIKYRDGSWQAQITIDDDAVTWRYYNMLQEAIENEVVEQ